VCLTYLTKISNQLLDEAEKGSKSLGPNFPAGTSWCDVDDEAETSRRETDEGRQGTQNNNNNNNNNSNKSVVETKASPHASEEGRRSPNNAWFGKGIAPLDCIANTALAAA